MRRHGKKISSVTRVIRTVSSLIAFSWKGNFWPLTKNLKRTGQLLHIT